jgi:hypothetical protein
MIAVDPTFDQGYIAVANYLLPRWHGSPEELGRLARRAMEESGSALGPVAYVRVATVPALTERGKIVKEYPFDYKVIKSGFQDLDGRYPNSSRTINFYAWFSLTYGDIATARPLIDRIARDWTLDADEVWGSRAFFDRVQATVSQQPAK